NREALALFRELFNIRRKAGAPKSELAISVYNLGIFLHVVGEFAEADALATEYADWATQELGAETPVTDRLLGLTLRIWVDRGRLDEAIDRGRKVLAYRRKAYPAGHYVFGMLLVDLGRAQVRRGNFEVAKRDLDEAYDILRNPSLNLPGYWVPWVQC